MAFLLFQTKQEKIEVHPIKVLQNKFTEQVEEK